MSETVLVTIPNIQYIPFINITGPISYPIAVTRDTCENLKKLGFDVKEHGSDRSQLNLEVEVSHENVPTPPPVEGHGSEPLVSQPTELPAHLSTIDEPKEVYAEEVVSEIEVEIPSEEGDVEEIAVYDISVYQKWKVEQIRSYLESAKEYLDEETIEKLPNMTKTELLEVVETTIVPMAD